LALPITQLDAPALVKPLSSYGVRIIGVNIFVIKVVVKSWLCVVELSTRSILSRNLDRSGGSAPSKKSVKPFDGGWREDKLGVIICSDVVCLLCDCVSTHRVQATESNIANILLILLLLLGFRFLGFCISKSLLALLGDRLDCGLASNFGVLLSRRPGAPSRQSSQLQDESWLLSRRPWRVRSEHWLPLCDG
ncbi:unnamed protein product, partial [Mycena citricolor]